LAPNHAVLLLATEERPPWSFPFVSWRQVGIGAAEAQKIAEKKSGDTARSNYEAKEAYFPPKRAYVGIRWTMNQRGPQKKKTITSSFITIKNWRS